MAWPAALPAIIGAATGVWNAVSGDQANKDARSDASANNAWQAYMSNTAHFREVQDLQNAGLNPILSAGGSGAPAPSGGTAPIKAPELNFPQVQQLGSLVQLAQNQQEIGIKRDKADAEIAKIKAEIPNASLKGKKIKKETESLGSGAVKSLDQGVGELIRSGIDWLKKGGARKTYEKKYKGNYYDDSIAIP